MKPQSPIAPNDGADICLPAELDREVRTQHSPDVDESVRRQVRNRVWLVGKLKKLYKSPR